MHYITKIAVKITIQVYSIIAAVMSKNDKFVLSDEVEQSTSSAQKVYFFRKSMGQTSSSPTWSKSAKQSIDHKQSTNLLGF